MQSSLDHRRHVGRRRPWHRRPVTAGQTDGRSSHREPVTPTRVDGPRPGPRAADPLAALRQRGSRGPRAGTAGERNGGDAAAPARVRRGDPGTRAPRPTHQHSPHEQAAQREEGGRRGAHHAPLSPPARPGRLAPGGRCPAGGSRRGRRLRPRGRQNSGTRSRSRVAGSRPNPQTLAGEGAPLGHTESPALLRGRGSGEPIGSGAGRERRLCWPPGADLGAPPTKKPEGN